MKGLEPMMRVDPTRFETLPSTTRPFHFGGTAEVSKWSEEGNWSLFCCISCLSLIFIGSGTSTVKL